jgi:TolB-like protein/Tfp pilus assembly protein PilF
VASPVPDSPHVRFGPFELDPSAGRLLKSGIPLKLQPQPFRVLLLLTSRAGQVVTREEIQSHLWGDSTFVDFERGINFSINQIRAVLCDDAEKPRYVETLPRVGYRFIGVLEPPHEESSGGGPGASKSLAVLPLENLSRDPEQEYFAEGMTEALITTLAKISTLRVASRTTVMYYKSVRRPLPEIARELQVNSIVEGTILRLGDRVRISAKLIDARSDKHLWAESYECDLRDILNLQSNVARAVAREIEVKLTPQEQQQLGGAQAVNAEAYEAYLKARYHWNKLTPHGIKKAVDYFQQAIAKDSSYAAAYTGLADCSSRLAWWGFVPPAQGFGAAKAAAQRAVQMDPGLAEAHGSLGWAILHYDWDCVGAEREFRTALGLNPTYAGVSHFYAACLAAIGRWDESITEIKRVLKLDPLSPIVNMTAAVILQQARRFDESIEYSRRALELDPDFCSAMWALGIAYEEKGMYAAAIAELEHAIRGSDGHPYYMSALGHIYASAGRRDDALRIIEQLKERSQQSYIMPYGIAGIYACLKERDEAFCWLERAYQERSAYLVYLNVSPGFDNLRSDPRFNDLLRRMNFPVYGPY